jgi:hypothetical protein
MRAAERLDGNEIPSVVSSRVKKNLRTECRRNTARVTPESHHHALFPASTASTATTPRSPCSLHSGKLDLSLVLVLQ